MKTVLCLLLASYLVSSTNAGDGYSFVKKLSPNFKDVTSWKCFGYTIASGNADKNIVYDYDVCWLGISILLTIALPALLLTNSGVNNAFARLDETIGQDSIAPSDQTNIDYLKYSQEFSDSSDLYEDPYRPYV